MLNTGLLEQGTAFVRHRLGLDYRYQFDKVSAIRGGASFVFAGRNTPQTIQAYVALGFDF